MALTDSRPRPLPDRAYQDADLAEAVRRSNHDTSLASWSVAMMTVGVLLQVAWLAAAPLSPAQLGLVALLAPLLAAGTRVVLLLDRAAAALGAARSAGQILAGLETRGFWTLRARLWSHLTAAGFCVWTIAVQLTLH
ncbi:hypothetical protein LO762_12925 [Actinocorallia sp. API 0066]|uniref:hypothetical protein n=1 Tax=Actinocorallia sp. API 0066 TaxID=2896846 RepID=UPI001E3CA293|nr:hypothetical protein [Actinocorallia sp. API 0066]MCD0450089.1 hypothetical protein [Actinocorallia sp. API 0066]